ncbi:MAG TPA: fibrillarin-like rRNA/tRNA 2'-O-methyltransferase [Candidatus Bilamarchaeum sp.]|nr:fibrillarin-like rRNA/tRNA 2'-O-methyltransferase [Candidatus Bilamarchaeum sp.]
MKTVYPGVYQGDKHLATLNADPGNKVYNEKTVREEGREYRLWDPFRSKLCGAMHKGLKNFPFAPGTKILYLGASTGTTISHLSDIVGGTGEIFAVEISPQCMKGLMALSDRRHNIIPIHADARQPQEYEDVGPVDAIYQDVAQPDQDSILIKNAKAFLKAGGLAMICIKSQSIDVTKDPEVVFAGVLKALEREFEVLEKIRLEPFDKDHLFVVLRYPGAKK